MTPQDEAAELLKLAAGVSLETARQMGVKVDFLDFGIHPDKERMKLFCPDGRPGGTVLFYVPLPNDQVGVFILQLSQEKIIALLKPTVPDIEAVLAGK